jgi:urease accessory protein
MRFALFLAFLAAAPAAFAHPETVAGGAAIGFAHPFTGWDHLLAMVIVGVWAARYRGLARLALPSAFAGGMLVGALHGRAGIPFPALEPMILASIVVFAAALAAAARIPPAAGVALIALFALAHGYAHLAEMPGEAMVGAFAAGMLAGTAVLHAIGLGVGLGIGWRAPRFSVSR